MRALGLLLVLVALVSVGGYVNYQRNAHLDKELKFRPYAGLSDSDLQALIDAYQGQVQHLSQNFSKGGPGTLVDGAAPSDLEAKISAFEHFQREHERWREGRRQILGEQTTVDALRKEQQLRAQGLHKPWVRIYRRVTAF